MAFKDILPGKYIAKPLRGGVGEAKTGTKQVGVEFSINTETGPETIWWYGFLSEGALKYTIEALAKLDFTGDDQFGPGAINLEKQVELVIELNEYNGKKSPKVAYINELGGSTKFQGLKPNELKASGLDLQKEMKAFYLGQGKPVPTPGSFADRTNVPEGGKLPF